MKIRKLNEQTDLDPILELIALVGETFIPPVSHRPGAETPILYFKYLIGENIPYIKARHEGAWEELVPQGVHVYVATDANGTFLGYIAFYEFLPTYGCAYLASFMVIPELQNNGVGKALLNKMMEVLHTIGCSYIVATTWATNYGSVAAMERVGFTTYKVVQGERVVGTTAICDGLYLKAPVTLLKNIASLPIA